MSESDSSVEKGINFNISNTGKGEGIKPLLSPLTGDNLTQDEDGFYFDKVNGRKYVLDNGKAVPLVSPLSGGDLVRAEDGLYFGESEGCKYVLGEGKMVPLVDPMSGSDLVRGENEEFVSKTTGKNFELYKNNFVPLYVPDETLESAHIEDGRLVGNETGRSFEIDEKGNVLTPFEVERRTEAERQVQEVIERNESFEGEVNRLILKTMKEFGDSFLEIEDNESKVEEVEKLRKKYDGRMEKISSWYLRYLNSLIERGRKTKEELEVRSLEELEKELGFEIEPEKEIEPEI